MAYQSSLSVELFSALGKGMVVHVVTAVISAACSIPGAVEDGELSVIALILLGTALMLEFVMCIPYLAIIISTKKCLKYSAFHQAYVSFFLFIVIVLILSSAAFQAASSATEIDTVVKKVFGWISTVLILIHAVSTFTFYIRICLYVFNDNKPAAPSNNAAHQSNSQQSGDTGVQADKSVNT